MQTVRLLTRRHVLIILLGVEAALFALYQFIEPGVPTLRLMVPALWLKASALWLAILVLAIFNGTLREKVLIPALGSAAGLAASGATLSVCIFLVAWAGTPWYGPQAAQQWLQVGVFWLLLTLAFEFGFGRLAQHKTWSELLEAYTFKGGNLWPLVLAATLVAPWLAAKVRGLLE